MDRYAATGRQDVTTITPGDSTLGVEGDAATRAKLYELMFSHGGTPADNVIQWLVRRFTAVGTRTGVTPTALDDGAPAAQLAAGEDHTVEPTYTAGTELIDEDLNQRTTFRFVAAPGGEFVIPANATNGIGATAISAYTADTRVTAHWLE